MSILIYLDTNSGKISKAAMEAASYGSKIAKNTGGTSTVITYGNCDDTVLATLGNYGVTKVLVKKDLSHPDDRQLTKLVAAAAEKESASIIIFSHDLTGRAVAPRLAAKLEAGFVPGAVAYPSTEGEFTVKVNMFSGKASAEIAVNSPKKVISVMPNSVGHESGTGTATIENFTADCGTASIKIKEVKKNEGEISLPEADLVVSAGRGMKGPENWGLIEELAKELGAATACSRPVADIGWRPHHEHVGQTGIAIAPNLYIAVGISGAIQHLAGVNRSKVIVVINTDPEAPFFKAADYGIVGDAFQVIPKLTEAVKKLKASHH